MGFGSSDFSMLIRALRVTPAKAAARSCVNCAASRRARMALPMCTLGCALSCGPTTRSEGREDGVFRRDLRGTGTTIDFRRGGRSQVHFTSETQPRVKRLARRGSQGAPWCATMTASILGNARTNTMSTSTIARCTARSVASYEAVSDDLASLTLALWGTTSRVAHGRELSDRDRRVLDESRYAVANQCQMLRYVQAQAAAPGSQNVTPVLMLPASGDMLELAWEAAQALRFDLPESIEGAEQLVEALGRIASGDQDAATRLVPLFKRVALLAEQRTG